MNTIKVHLIRTRDVPSFPPLDAVGRLSLQRWFSQATGDELRLTIQQDMAVNEGGICDAATLHRILREVIPEPTDRPVSEIGVIFCRKWVARDAHLRGLMFDYIGRDPILGPFTDGGVPREGCAVFLDEFASDDDYGKIFTAIHELGHIFNLGHDSTNKSFMGAINEMPGFNGRDSLRLLEAANGNWNHAPGGANFQEGDVAERWDKRKKLRKRNPSLILKVFLAKQSYLIGEPIVLELELKTRNHRIVRALPELDPGYASCRIWIENPFGERYLHRSNLYYCYRNSGSVRVSNKDPLHNNPRISFGSSGMNFGRPGIYRVWAEYLPKPGKYARVITSNKVELEICLPRNDLEETIKCVLSQAEVAFFLAHKGGYLSRSNLQALKGLVRKSPKHPALQHARYALGWDSIRLQQYQQAKDLLSGLSLKETSFSNSLSQTRKKLTKLCGRA